MKTCALTLALLLAGSAAAESTRIEVYPGGQAYVDVRPGNTLGEIVRRLAPGNRALQKRLMQQLLQLNPRAFIDADPNRLKAGARLWLPGQVKRLQQTLDTRRYHIEAFSWGYVQRPR